MERIIMIRPRLVIADDDVAVTRLLESRLGEVGLDSTVCHSGEDAYAAVASEEYAIVIADWNMPGLSGIELCQKIRTSLPLSTAYVILLTSNGQPEQIAAGLAAGADDYLVKPANEVELRARIEVGVRTLRLLAGYAARADEVRLAHNRTELLLAAIPSILIGVDAGGQVIRWNQAAEETFGLRAVDVLKRPLRDCGVQWDWSCFEPLLEQCRAGCCTLPRDELRFQHADGRDGCLGITITPVPWEDGEELGFLLIAADISQRKIMQNQLAQSQKLESIGQLAAGIAHEINTPTQFVGDNTRFLQDAFGDLQALLKKYSELVECSRAAAIVPELLAEIEAAEQSADVEYLASEIPQAIAQSLEGIERVTRIVRAMKDFSHPGSEGMESVDLNKAIESTVTVARNEWKYVAELVTEFDESLPPVTCLAGEFNQVILNIVINAAHAIADVIDAESGEKGTITITTRRDHGWAEVRIADTGQVLPRNTGRRCSIISSRPRKSARAPARGLRSPIRSSPRSTPARSRLRASRTRARPSSSGCRLNRSGRSQQLRAATRMTISVGQTIWEWPMPTRRWQGTRLMGRRKSRAAGLVWVCCCASTGYER